MGGHLDDRSEFEGKLRFSDTLRIDGRFVGEIESDGHLVIGEKAEVRASIHVASISVSGRLKGSVRATERVEIFKDGRMECDIATPSLRIEEGAVLQGSCETSPQRGGGGAPKPLDMSQVARKLSP